MPSHHRSRRPHVQPALLASPDIRANALTDRARPGAEHEAAADPNAAGPAARRGEPLDVFIHIPKTAGTTLTSVLRENYPLGGVRGIGNVVKGSGGANPDKVTRLRNLELLSAVVQMGGPRLLRGHLPFAIRELLPADTRYFTMLRAPVERTLSHYYRVIEVRRNQLPDSSLEGLFEAKQYMLDNLQTRMLSVPFEPFGEITEATLEQAKANLRDGFVAFGLVERFDESLVLLKRRLGLRSILYRHHERRGPRAREDAEDLGRVAERFNAFDLELYHWASELFERTIGEQDEDFVAEVAVLKALSGSGLQQPTGGSELGRAGLSELLVTGRTELLGRALELLEARNAAALSELRDLLERANAALRQVSQRVERIETELTKDAPAATASETDGETGKKQRKPRKRAIPREGSA